MPRVVVTGAEQAAGVSRWHITESEGELLEAAAASVPEEIHHPVKRLEWLAGRALLMQQCRDLGIRWKGVVKDQHGKPFLVQSHAHLSVSNSFPWIACQLRHEGPAGIDIEQPRPSLLRVLPRMLSPTELSDAGDSQQKSCVYWCAKEALFKWHGERGIHFSRHIEIRPFTYDLHGGQLTAALVTHQLRRSIELQYVPTTEWTLVYALSEL
ncbi:MAG: 4'-phosphopantetheinyl transferase superfamily protein [Cyclobacteriaceae bacterium]|nr:4'-phosphopantetheinyl transferase superfamily protein [Cyclobacteriaceae bacterium]